MPERMTRRSCVKGLGLACAAAVLMARPAAAADSPPDFTGLWAAHVEPGSAPFGNSRSAQPAPPFTPEGKRLSDEYKKLIGPGDDNPAAYCVSYGMPTMMEMVGGYPLEIIQKPDQITMIYEVDSETRRIYFGTRGLAKEDRIPSRQGYSAGHWEGDTLVVETTDLTAGQDHIFHPHSDQAKIVERFRLGKTATGGRMILYEMTLTDPVYYTEPVKVERKWDETPDGHIIAYNCPEEAWMRLLDARRAQLKAGKPVTAKMKDVIEVY